MEALKQFLQEILETKVTPFLRSRKQVDEQEVAKRSVMIQDIIKDINSEKEINNLQEVKLRFGGSIAELENIIQELVGIGAIDDKYAKEVMEILDDVSRMKEFSFVKWKRTFLLALNGLLGKIGKYSEVAPSV